MHSLEDTALSLVPLFVQGIEVETQPGAGQEGLAVPHSLLFVVMTPVCLQRGCRTLRAEADLGPFMPSCCNSGPISYYL